MTSKEVLENIMKDNRKFECYPYENFSFKNKNGVINILKNMNYYIKLFDINNLNKEERKEILSYVYDVIITLDELVNELEKDSSNE